MAKARDPLLPLLACPRCVKARLETAPEGYRCKRCKSEFPHLVGIPWLFPNPGVAWDEWRARHHAELRRLEHDATAIEAELEDEALLPETRARLEHLAHAERDQAERLVALLEPLELGTLEANHATHLALRTRLPADQGLHTYFPNVHRDWAWGEEENAASIDLVNAALGDGERGAQLVLGAGAARLAYDLHAASSAERTLALDFNPMLLLVAKQMVAGERLSLWEFPLAPKTGADCAVLQELGGAAPLRPGFELILGDALRTPFTRGAFDAVVTPWLLDVVPCALDTFAARTNALLAEGGRWVHFGSLVFTHPAATQRPCLDEIGGLLERAGFALSRVEEHTIPYLCSPHSRHGRREHVVTFAADKVRDVDPPAQHTALPDFIVKDDEPVPALPSFQQQAMATRIHAYVMSLIDGERTLADMAVKMEEQELMPRDQALGTLRTFLIKMYAESQRSGGGLSAR